MKLSVSMGTENNLILALIGYGAYDSMSIIKQLGYTYGECYTHACYTDKVWYKEINNFRNNAQGVYAAVVDVYKAFGNIEVDLMGYGMTLDRVIKNYPCDNQ